MSKTQRMPPLPKEAWTHEMRTLFTMLEGPDAYENGSKSNAILTLARHPELASSFFKFNARLLMNGRVSPRIREIAVLRVAWLNQSVYEWAQHVRAALLPDVLSSKQIEAFKRGEAAVDEGEGLLTQAHIDATKIGASDPIWSEAERLVLMAVDQLKASSRVDDATWEGLGKHFDEAEVIEILIVIGLYAMLAGVFNSLDIEPEPAQHEFARQMLPA